MRTRLSEATTRHFVILGTPVILIAGGLAAFEMGGYRLAALVLGISILALGILAWQFRPKWWGNTRVQAISITILGGIAMVVVTDELWLAAFAAFYERLQSAFPEALPVISFQPSLTFQNRLWTMVSLGVIFVVLNYIWGRQNTLPNPDVSRTDEEPFGKKDYEQLRDEYCAYMLRQLDQYDDDLNWSDTDYTKLEAEVEVDRRGNRTPRVEKDLVRAIRRDRTTRAFLLLGDPGSGKSVSLRRLCRQLYGEVTKTGVVPVYINLREWDSPSDPTDEQLSDFIAEHMKQAAGRAGKRFLNQWYEPMLSAGRFFFLLDSFDELPSVLDCDDASPRIKEISRTFDRFFHDIHQCRGVLASRRFRQPRGFQGRRMSIRPLKEIQIREAMTRWLSGLPLNPTEIIRDLFRNRPELVPVVRNPFLADLTSQYLIQHNGELPPNQFAIYDSFIRHRLKEDEASLKELGLETAQVLDAATHIARKMYDDPEAGLEVEAERVQDWVFESNPDVVVEALYRIRLIRLSKDTSKRFSFVHRRFTEFFVVCSLIEDDVPIPFESIPEDSRWRDCLVVFCGVAPEDKVQPIADFCWRVISEQGSALDQGGVEAARPVVHTLRFLRDAFVARSSFLDKFRSDLENRILAWIKGGDLLVAKIATECLGILEAEVRAKGIQAALGRPSSWLRETAFYACRHLGSLEEEEIRSIRGYIRVLPSFRIIRGHRDLTFALSLSESLAGQLWGVRRDILWLLILWLGVVPWLSWEAWVSGGKFALEMFLYLSSATSLLIEALFVLGIGSSPFFRLGFDTSLRLALALVFVLFAGARVYGFGVQFIWLVLLLSPWEFWPEVARFIKRAARRIEFTTKALRQFIKYGIGLICFIVLATGLAYVSTQGSEESTEGFMSDSTQVYSETEKFRVYAEFAEFLSFLLIVLLIVGAIVFPLARKVAHFLIGYVRDSHFFQKAEFSAVVDYNLVYRSCRALHIRRSRHKFLETLRLRQVELKGDPIPLPDEEWVDDGVREGMARLESMWFGLDE